jgi:Kef-type K+ transport system membrane component KefB
MFIAGLDIDIADFKKNSHKSFIFGLLTFSIPMIFGLITGKYIVAFQLNCLAGIMLYSSIFASHTLVTYPTIVKYGIKRNRAVNITIGGTLITNVLALLILAIVVGVESSKVTSIDPETLTVSVKYAISYRFWLDLILYFSVFAVIVTYVFPMLARKFLKFESDNVSQYLFILGMVFLAAFLAEISKMEAIIGAFLAGIALNQFIPETSPLKNRIEFIGNALFIPIFLIGVGMLINFRVFTDLRTIVIAVIMIAVAMGSKYLAALFTQKILRYTADERRIIFGLSNSQAAATLAVVIVGRKIELFDTTILDASVLMILVTILISSISTEKGARNISQLEEPLTDKEIEPDIERILIPISHPDTLEDLMNLGLTIKDKKHKNNIYATNIITTSENKHASEKKAKDLLEKAAKIVAATDQQLHEIVRYDVNVPTGIYNIASEHKITDIIIGLHQKSSITDTFLGNLTEGILAKCVANTYIYHSVQPWNTMQRMVVVIPENAEKEEGFKDFIKKLWNLATNGGTKFVVFASETVNEIFLLYKAAQTIELELINFTDWEDFLIVSSKINANSGLMIFMSRPGSISRNEEMGKISKYLNRYFNRNNYILFYPTPLLKIEEKVEIKKKKKK